MEGLRATGLIILGCLLWLGGLPGALAERINPPWQLFPQPGKAFNVPGVDNAPDLYGDVGNPQLVIFFAGNQFMVVPALLKAFQEVHPQYERIYVETLPPGILADQIKEGALIVGNLRISIQPDIYTAGEEKIEEIQKERQWFDESVNYARNRLAIMVYRGNPRQVKSLKDLGRSDLRVSMPNPQWEGIAAHIIEAYRKAGGESLVRAVMEKKIADGTTFLTQIHHRQTPMRIMEKKSDAGLGWFTEGYFQELIDNPIGWIEIPAHHNVVVTYAAARMKNALHPQAASDFLQFLRTDEAQDVYRRYGFMPPE